LNDILDLHPRGRCVYKVNGVPVFFAKARGIGEPHRIVQCSASSYGGTPLGARVSGKEWRIEKEYIELTRDYEGLRKKYNDISNKLLEARVSQGMEASQRGERFVVVDTAPLPEKPYKPNRIAIIAFGFILALSAGLSLVAINEAMDHSIKSADELNQIPVLNVFSVVSYIETPEEKRKRKIKKSVWLLCIIGFLVIALMIFDQFVMSIDKMWIEIGQRLGITTI